MAKDYTWFKFKIPDWMMGKIQKQKPEVRGVFLNLTCKYWQKQCKLTIVDGMEAVDEVDYAYANLLSKGIITENDGMVCIAFLDEQWAENQELHEKQSKGGKTSAAKRYNSEDDPSNLQGTSNILKDTYSLLISDLQVTSCNKIEENEIREEENREEGEKKEEIDYNSSDTPTGAPTDKNISINKWIEGFDKRKIEFQESLYPYTHKPPKYTGSYEPAMLKEFFEYWAEPNKSRSKMRWEQEKTWELALRLSRWAANQKTNKSINQIKTGNVHQTALQPSKSGFGSLSPRK